MELDYKKLGFRCGLEIHQQLEGKKLFCPCPTVIRKDKPDFMIKRKLRASAGETGEIDIAARHEQEKDKYFIYQGYNDTTCLVETDEEPPHDVNKDALRTALQVAHLLNARIVDEIRFMRKTVVDGSNTSGFQRTALVAADGFIEVGGKKIMVPTVCLEEEACQIVERKKDYDTYNLSRLGIPLIEIATSPGIENPEQCKEAALKIGMILRSVEGMKRGIGTIRQDVNVSIKDGARTEIKGFQEVKSIPAVIENEIKRQMTLIGEGKKLQQEVRKAEPDGTTTFLRPMPGADRMYPETDVAPIRVEKKGIGKVELISEKAEKLGKLGLGKDLADSISKSGRTEVVLGFSEKFKDVKPAFIAETMLSTPTTIRRKENVNANLTDEQFGRIFKELNEGKISKDSVYSIILDLGKTGKLDFSKYEMMPDKELEKELKAIVDGNKGIQFNAIIGKAMAKLRGKADGKKIVEILKKLYG